MKNFAANSALWHKQTLFSWKKKKNLDKQLCDLDDFLIGSVDNLFNFGSKKWDTDSA